MTAWLGRISAQGFQCQRRTIWHWPPALQSARRLVRVKSGRLTHRDTEQVGSGHPPPVKQPRRTGYLNASTDARLRRPGQGAAVPSLLPRRLVVRETVRCSPRIIGAPHQEHSPSSPSSPSVSCRHRPRLPERGHSWPLARSRSSSPCSRDGNRIAATGVALPKIPART